VKKADGVNFQKETFSPPCYPALQVANSVRESIPAHSLS